MTATTTAPAPAKKAVKAEEKLAQMPEDLKSRHQRALEIKAELEKLEFELDGIKETFGERLQQAEVDAFTLFGKARVRRSSFNRHMIDSAALQEKHPRIFKAFLKSTPVVSLRIT